MENVQKETTDQSYLGNLAPFILERALSREMWVRLCQRHSVDCSTNPGCVWGHSCNSTVIDYIPAMYIAWGQALMAIGTYIGIEI